MQATRRRPTNHLGAAMLTRIACSSMGTICATACAVGLAVGTAQALAQTADSSATPVTPSPGPARHHQWTPPDYTDADLATQDRLVPIPAAAKRGRAEFNGTPIIKLNGKTEQLAPGARVFGADNMLKVSGALNGRAHVKYLREQSTGLLMQLWILTPKEIETPDPKPISSSN